MCELPNQKGHVKIGLGFEFENVFMDVLEIFLVVKNNDLIFRMKIGRDSLLGTSC